MMKSVEQSTLSSVALKIVKTGGTLIKHPGKVEEMVKHYENAGILTITIIEAKLVRDTHTFGEMNPLVMIKSKDKVHETKIHNRGGTHPVWHETFEIPIFSLSMNDGLKLSCYDVSMFNRDLVGEASVPLQNMCYKQGLRGWIPIDFNSKRAGHIRIETKYDPPDLTNIKVDRSEDRAFLKAFQGDDMRTFDTSDTTSSQNIATSS